MRYYWLISGYIVWNKFKVQNTHTTVDLRWKLRFRKSSIMQNICETESEETCFSFPVAERRIPFCRVRVNELQIKERRTCISKDPSQLQPTSTIGNRQIWSSEKSIELLRPVNRESPLLHRPFQSCKLSLPFRKQREAEIERTVCPRFWNFCRTRRLFSAMQKITRAQRAKLKSTQKYGDVQ